jgi:hypothetical protein
MSIFFVTFHRYIKVNLLPGSAQQLTTIRTNLVSEFIKPIFGNSFAVTMPLNSIYSKSLQISVVSVIGQKEEWVVSIFFFEFIICNNVEN